MTHETVHPAVVPMLAAVSLLLGGSTAPASPAPTWRAPVAAPESLTATVRAVDARARTLEVITGVGHALRVVRIEVDPACQIRVEDRAAGLGDVKPGALVRIRYRKAGDRAVAETIDARSLQGPAGER